MPGSIRKPRCKHCGSTQKRNGFTTAGTQRWRCLTCGVSTTKTQPARTHHRQLDEFLSWLLGKHAQHEVTTSSARTFRRVHAWCWNITPTINPTGVVQDQVIVDGLYLSKNTCILIAINTSNTVIAWQWCSRESIAAWTALLKQIPAPTVLISDGGTGLATARQSVWPATKMQRCVYHLYCQVRRELTLNPRTPAGKSLLALARRLMHLSTRGEMVTWQQHLNDWHQQYQSLLVEKTYARKGPSSRYSRYEQRTWWWTHERLRKAYNVLARQVKTQQAFTYLHIHDLTVEATTNRIEGGINSLLRTMLKAHRGMPLTHQQRAIEWWLYLRSETPTPVHELITPEHLNPPPQRPATTPDADWRPQEYGTALTAEEGLWTRKPKT